jgi:hypothetical protein
MKTSNIKKKVAEKVSKGKDKVVKKCGKGAKCAAILFAIGLATAICGCSTADAPTAQRAQTVTVTDNTFNFNIGQCEPCVTNHTAVIPSFHFEFGTAAQANETSGTETMSATNDLKPTNTTEVPIDVRYNDAMAAASTASRGVLSSIGSGLDGVLQLMQSGQSGTVQVTKTDGTAATVRCADGQCSFCEDCTPAK